MKAGSIISGQFVAPITIMFLRIKPSNQGQELHDYSSLNFPCDLGSFWGNVIDLVEKIIARAFFSASLKM